MSDREDVLRAWANTFTSGFLDVFAHPFVFIFALSYYGFTGDRRPVDWIIDRAE